MIIFVLTNAIIQYPHPGLREAIDYYWFHEVPHSALRAYNIPFLHQELIISYGDDFSLNNASQQYQYTERGSISGLLHSPSVTLVNGSYKALGILFKPFGLYRLFGISATQLIRQPLTLESIWGTSVGPMLQKLLTCDTPTSKMQILEEFLLQRIAPLPVPDELLQLQHTPSTSKGYIQSCLSAALPTARKYISYCRETVGFTPKRFSHLCLINASLRQIANQPATSLTEVGYDNGFYDQSHFVRIFRSLTGITPSAYRKAVKAQKVSSSFPNTIFL